MICFKSVIVKANGMYLSVRDGQLAKLLPSGNRVGEGRENTTCGRNKTSQIPYFVIGP